MARTEINSLDGPAGNDYTGSYDGVAPAYLHTEVFDSIHVQNIINEIDGKDSTGSKTMPVPTIFGTNFQTLSVAQKASNAAGGGYADAAFTPNSYVKAAITWLDGSIGQIAAELKARHHRRFDAGRAQRQARPIARRLRQAEEDRPCCRRALYGLCRRWKRSDHGQQCRQRAGDRRRCRVRLAQ